MHTRWEKGHQGAGGFTEIMMRQNAAALLHDRAPGISYSPKHFVGMQLLVTEVGRIVLERRPRSRDCGKNGSSQPRLFGTCTVTVPAGVSTVFAL